MTVGSLADLTLTAGEDATVQLSGAFRDPDGKTLTFSAQSSSPQAATVAVSGTTATVSAVAAGSATVTVTATDPKSASASLTFTVTVQARNQAPTTTGELEDRTVTAGDEVTVNVADNFTDADGDALTFTAASSDSDVATVTSADAAITVTAVAVGSATITVTATDPDGASASSTFAVTVQARNQAPTTTGELEDRAVTVGDEVTVDVADNFTDADGDALTFTAASSASDVATVTSADAAITVTAVAIGSTTITVTATDPDGASAGLSFEAVVYGAITAAEPSLSFEANKTFRFSWAEAANATYYKLLEDPDGASGYAQLGEDIAGSAADADASEDDLQVDHVVPLHARTQAQYVLQSCNPAGCEDSAPLRVGKQLEGMVSSIGYFKASQPGDYDVFGLTMSLSGDGNTLAVGAMQEDSAATGIDGDATDNSAENSGAVYVFARQADGSWRQQAYIKATNTDAFDAFGTPALSADGNTLAVGASAEDSGSADDPNDDSMMDAGAVYVYTRDADGAWTNQAYLKSAAPAGEDLFGFAVDLSADGNRLAVGMPFGGAGAVHVFQRTASQWQRQGVARATSGEQHDALGASVALSADGRVLVAGAPFESSAATGINGNAADNSAQASGAVYVFSFTGSDWQQEAYLKADNTDVNDQFGIRMALSGDGTVLAVGVGEEDSAATGINGDGADNSADEAGAAYVFVRSGGGWMQNAYIKASNTDAGDEFGAAVALNQDGSLLAVGSESEDGSGTGLAGDPDDNSGSSAGAVYVYRRTSGGWVQQAYVKASNTDADEDDFGISLALSDDGDVLAVGAYGEDSAASGVNGDQSDKSLEWSGAVYLY